LLNAFILFYTSIGFWKDALKRGDAPDVLPYGLHHLEDFGVSVNYSDMAQRKLVKLPFRPVERWIFGCDVVQPLMLAGRMRKSDVVITPLDR
jgi:hypothetical protein